MFAPDVFAEITPRTVAGACVPSAPSPSTLPRSAALREGLNRLRADTTPPRAHARTHRLTHTQAVTAVLSTDPGGALKAGPRASPRVPQARAAHEARCPAPLPRGTGVRRSPRLSRRHCRERHAGGCTPSGEVLLCWEACATAVGLPTTLRQHPRLSGHPRSQRPRGTW